MKNLKMFAIGLAAMTAMTTGVHAATYIGDGKDTSGQEAYGIANCLRSTDETSNCTLTKSTTIENGADIKGNITLNLQEGVVLTLGKALTVENGKSLTINGGEIVAKDANNANAIVVNAGGTLKVDNTKLTATATSPAHEAQSVIAVIGGAASAPATKVTIGSKTTVTGPNGLIVYANNRTSSSLGSGAANNVTVDVDGTWDVKGYAVQTQGTIKNSTSVPVINVNGGSYKSENVALYAAGDGKWTIAKDVKAEGAEAIFVKSGEMTINGGEFTATSTTCNGTKPSGSNAQGYGAALTVVKDSNTGYAGQPKVTVKDGKFLSKNCSAVRVTGGTSTNMTVALEGGNYDAPKATNIVDSAFGGIVYGGTFTKALPGDNYLATGLKQKTINGITYVGEEFKITTEVNEENGKIDTITTPVTVISGITVKISDYVKVTPADGYVVVYKVTDKDGKDVAVTDGTFVMPESDVTVTVSFAVKTAETVPGDNTGDANIPGEGTTTPEKTPQTGDSIMTFMGLGLASIAVVGLGAKNLKKQTN